MLRLSDAFISINFQTAEHVLIHGVIIRRGTSPSLHVNLAPSDVASFLVECFPGFSRKPDSHSSSLCEQWLCLLGGSGLLFKMICEGRKLLGCVSPDVYFFFPSPFPFTWLGLQHLWSSVHLCLKDQPVECTMRKRQWLKNNHKWISLCETIAFFYSLLTKALCTHTLSKHTPTHLHLR